MGINAAQYYNSAPFIAAIQATSVANLPNRSGSTSTIPGLQAGQVAAVGANFYQCYDPTSGSAIWFLLGAPRVPGQENQQTVAAATGTVLAGVDRVLVTYAAGGCTITLPTVLGGAPIGTTFVIEKANTSANGITITPDSGASINAGVADANMTMVGLNSTASTTASSASTNDIAVRLTRTGALTWRATPV